MAADSNDNNDSDKNILEKLIGGIKEAVDVSNQDKLLEKVGELKQAEKKVGDVKLEARAKTPIGLDVGTSRIVGLKKVGGELISKDQLNAFFNIQRSTFSKEMLEKNKIHYKDLDGGQIAILGYSSQEFCNIFNGEVRRPMKQGLLKADEPEAIQIIKEIISLVIERPKELGGSLCFSVPAPQVGFESDLIFHESILKKFLVGMGYNAKSITEGMAIVLSELSQDNYTGIGISMGGGMCNVCLSFLSVPIIVFSIAKGGDDIDLSVARVVNETKNRVRLIKEESLDFSKIAKNRMDSAFEIYYDDLILSVLNQLNAVLSQAQNMPKLHSAIPIILAGGTSMPPGFKVKFDKVLKQVGLPIKISDVRLASDPMRATAKGALINAGV